MSTTAAQRFWAISELLLELAKYLDEEVFRKIILTSRQNHIRFLADAWRQVSGIGHLLAILHDSLAVRAVGKGKPEVMVGLYTQKKFIVNVHYQIPPLYQLKQERIKRFLMYTAVVQRLKVNSNPNRFVSWQGLDRLLPLARLAGPGRRVVMPQVTHFSIDVGPKYKKVVLAPYLKLCANRWLEQVWVSPNRSRVYPRSSLTDVGDAFQTLTGAFENQQPLRWLSCYPESLVVDREGRGVLTQHFLPLSRNLTFFNTTIWFVSAPLISALSTTPLERLEIQGSAPVPYFDVDLVNQLPLSDRAFPHLRLLLLQNVPLGFARQLLLFQPLIQNVAILRLEICDVTDLEEDDDILYLAVIQRLAAFPRLRELTFSSARLESARPYPVSMALLQPVIDKRLEHLRLFRICISDSIGLQRLRYPTIDNWQNLKTLTIMHQNLIPDDLMYLTGLPNLVELGGNVGREMSTPAWSPFVQGFAHHLTFTSQFRLPSQFQPLQDIQMTEAVVR